MIIEILVWVAYTIFTAWIGGRKGVYFTPSTIDNTDRMNTIRGKKFKTIEEQMTYVRERANFGQDFINVATSAVIYFLVFFLLVFPFIINFYEGLILAPLTAYVFAYITARYIHPKDLFEFQIINSFLSFLYVNMFLVYVKFIHSIHPLLLLLLSIAIMYGYGTLEAKHHGGNNKDRKTSTS